MSEPHPAPSSSTAARPGAGTTPALRVVAVMTAVCAVIATFEPSLSPSFDDSSNALADGGSDVIVYVFAGVTVLAFAGFVVKDAAVAAGLVGGVGATVFGYFSLVESGLHAIVDALDGIGGRSLGYGAGFVFGLLTMFAAATGVVMSIRSRAAGRDSSSAGGWAPLGMCAAATTTLGVMLPPNNSGQGFSERNFDLDPVVLEFGWLVFVASLGIPGIVGFASRTRWGLSAALGAWVPTAWLTLTAITGGERDFDDTSTTFTFDNIHPILAIAVAVQALSLILGYQAFKQASTDAATFPAPAPPAAPPPRVSPPDVSGLAPPPPPA